jgi:hypothetical protein
MTKKNPSCGRPTPRGFRQKTRGGRKGLRRRNAYAGRYVPWPSREPSVSGLKRREWAREHDGARHLSLAPELAPNPVGRGGTRGYERARVDAQVVSFQGRRGTPDHVAG